MFALTKRLTLRPVWPEDAGYLPPMPDLPTGAVAVTCAIATRDGGPPRTVGAIRLVRTARGADLHVAIVPAARGDGIAAEATGAMLAAARWSLGLREVTARIGAENLAGWRLARRLGFVPVARPAEPAGGTTDRKLRWTGQASGSSDAASSIGHPATPPLGIAA